MSDTGHPVVSEAMLDRLRGQEEGYLLDHILDDADGRYGGADGREALIVILGRLIVLTGSEDAAIKWLFDSRGYATVVKDDVCANLVDGSFWTLAMFSDWLKVIEAYRDTCPAFIEVVFRDGAVPERDNP